MSRRYLHAGIAVLLIGFWIGECQAQNSRGQNSRGQNSSGQCSRGQSSGRLGPPASQNFNGFTSNNFANNQSPYGNLFQQQYQRIQQQALAMRQQAYRQQRSRSGSGRIGQNQQELIAMRRQRADQKRMQRAERIAARIADRDDASALAKQVAPASTLLVSTTGRTR